MRSVLPVRSVVALGSLAPVCMTARDHVHAWASIQKDSREPLLQPACSPCRVGTGSLFQRVSLAHLLLACSSSIRS